MGDNSCENAGAVCSSDVECDGNWCPGTQTCNVATDECSGGSDECTCGDGKCVPVVPDTCDPVAGGAYTGTIQIVGNTCYGDSDIKANVFQAVGCLSFWGVDTREPHTCLHRDINVQSNICAGLTDFENLDFGLGSVQPPYELGGSHNVFDPDGDDPHSIAPPQLQLAQCEPTWIETLSSIPGTSGDLHLASSDTCAKDAGTDISAIVSTDIDGQLRGEDSFFDIGADESNVDATFIESIALSGTTGALTHAPTDINEVVVFYEAVRLQPTGAALSPTTFSMSGATISVHSSLMNSSLIVAYPHDSGTAGLEVPDGNYPGHVFSMANVVTDPLSLILMYEGTRLERVSSNTTSQTEYFQPSQPSTNIVTGPLVDELLALCPASTGMTRTETPGLAPNESYPSNNFVLTSSPSSPDLTLVLYEGTRLMHTNASPGPTEFSIGQDGISLSIGPSVEAPGDLVVIYAY